MKLKNKNWIKNSCNFLKYQFFFNMFFQQSYKLGVIYMLCMKKTETLRQYNF